MCSVQSITVYVAKWMIVGCVIICGLKSIKRDNNIKSNGIQQTHTIYKTNYTATKK